MGERARPDWVWRLTVGEAMLWLALARFLVSAIPLKRWRRFLGPLCEPPTVTAQLDPAALVFARAVNRGAARLPFETKCLPRAMALHAMLRRHRLPSVLVIGVLDPSQRGTIEDLHAWVESNGTVIIGALEEPFHPLARFGNGNLGN